MALHPTDQCFFYFLVCFFCYPIHPTAHKGPFPTLGSTVFCTFWSPQAPVSSKGQWLPVFILRSIHIIHCILKSLSFWSSFQVCNILLLFWTLQAPVYLQDLQASVLLEVYSICCMFYGLKESCCSCPKVYKSLRSTTFCYCPEILKTVFLRSSAPTLILRSTNSATLLISYKILFFSWGLQPLFTPASVLQFINTYSLCKGL